MELLIIFRFYFYKSKTIVMLSLSKHVIQSQSKWLVGCYDLPVFIKLFKCIWQFGFSNRPHSLRQAQGDRSGLFSVVRYFRTGRHSLRYFVPQHRLSSLRQAQGDRPELFSVVRFFCPGGVYAARLALL
jgi:hypothetical protein